MMWRFSAYFVVFVLLPAMCYAADPNEKGSEMDDRLNSFEKKFQEMERSMSRVEGIVVSNTLAMETFAKVLGKRYTEPSRIELYVSQQQEILSKLPTLQENMDKLFDNIQAQINTQTSQINSINEKIFDKIQVQINTQTSQINSINEKIFDKIQLQINTQTSQINSINEKIFDNIQVQINTQSSQINSSNEKLFGDIQAQINTQTTQIKSANENLLNNIQEQTINQTKSMNNIAEDIAIKLNDAINTTKERVQQHEDEFEVARARMEGMESLLKNIQTKVDDQTGTLKVMAKLLTTKTEQPSHLVEIKDNQATLKMELQNNFRTIKSELHSLKSSVGTMDSKVNLIKDVASKLNLDLVEEYRSKYSLSTDRTRIMNSACSNGDASVVTALLDLGMDVNTRVDSSSHTCLHYAAMNNWVNVVKVLLDRGANTELRDSTEHGETPLLEAAWYGKVDVARVLVGRGASVSARNKKYNKTPLGIAKHENKQEMINYLTSIGAKE